MNQNVSPGARSLWPEALLTLVVLLGIAGGVYIGRITTMSDLWFVCGILLVALLFHTLLFILRIMLFWATKDWEVYGPQAHQYWKHYGEQAMKDWEAHEKGKKK